MLLLFVLFAVVACVSGALVIAVVVSTLRGQGRFGINLRKSACPDCGTAAPRVRKPANLQQALWGGWSCSKCGIEIDKWGRRVVSKV